MPPLPPSVRAAVGTSLRAGLIQRIEDLTIWPRVQTVRTWFSTTQPTVPVVAVLRLITDQHQQQETVFDLKFPFIGPRLTEHAFVLGEGDNRLKQGLRQVMRISAPATEHLKVNPVMPIRSVQFTTLRRRATVRLQSIHVSLDGDSNSPGEMTFAFAVYDAETRDRIGEPQLLGEASIPDGRTTALNMSFPIEFAPDSLLLFAYALDNDSYDFPLPGTGFDLPGMWPQDHLAAGEDSGWGEEETWAATWGSFTMNLPLDGTESWSQSFRLDSPPGPVQFQVNFTVEAQVWSVAETSLPSYPKTTKTVRGLSMAGAIGQVAGAFGRSGHTHLVAVGHERELMVKRIPPPNALTRGASWRVIGALWSSPVSTVAGTDGRIHALTVDDAGAVRHRAWPEDADPSPEDAWDSLGGEMLGPVLTHVTSEGVELFARGRDGTIYHRCGLLDRAHDRPAAWTSLGACIGGSLDVVGSKKAGIHLFVHDEDGQVEHKWHDGRTWHPSSDAWLNLGNGGGEAIFASAGEDGGVAVVSIAEGGTVRWKEWRSGHWSPTKERWEAAESIDALLDSAPSDRPTSQV